MHLPIHILKPALWDQSLHDSLYLFTPSIKIWQYSISCLLHYQVVCRYALLFDCLVAIAVKSPSAGHGHRFQIRVVKDGCKSTRYKDYHRYRSAISQVV